jgi:hypothetical protein
MDTELSLKGRLAPTHSVKELGDLARTSDGQGPEVALLRNARPPPPSALLCNATPRAFRSTGLGPSPFHASLASL